MKKQKVGFSDSRFVVITGLLLVTAAYLFFHASTPDRETRLSIKQAAAFRIINLRFSQSDLLAINSQPASGQWIKGELAEKKKLNRKIKLRHHFQIKNKHDFQIRTGPRYFNLFRMTPRRQYLYKIFSLAPKWNITASRSYPVQLRINDVLVGIYLMEPVFFNQNRFANGDYLMAMGTECEMMRILLTDLSFNRTEALKKLFDYPEMSRYLTFFSLFYYPHPPRFENMILKYSGEEKKFSPFLSFESILLGQHTRFSENKRNDPADSVFFSKQTAANRNFVLESCSRSRFERLIREFLLQ